MLKHGVKPIVELSLMPKSLVACGKQGQKKCAWALNDNSAVGRAPRRL